MDTEKQSPARSQAFDVLLNRLLTDFLGDIEPAALTLLRDCLEWVELRGGQTLMAQGDPGDAMYLTVSGRLRTYITNEDGVKRMVREITRGQVVGEMALYTDELRSATLVAIRDTVLVRLGKEEFTKLLAMSAQVSIALTRQIISRLQTEGARYSLDRPVVMGLLPISAGIDVCDFAEKLASKLRLSGTVAVIDATFLDATIIQPGIAIPTQTDVGANRRVALRLDEIEASHDFVLLVGDATPTPWTHCCSRHCDELLLLADADQPAVIHPIEQECLVQRPMHTGAAEILILLHPADKESPRDTQAWLQRRALTDHVHIRLSLDRDMARLARLQSRTAVGLVLAGGGARGLAHIGVYRALLERGIEVDVVGGTSIGSIMAAYVAVDQPIQRVLDNARDVFSSGPTGDFNMIPMLSLIKGLRMRGLVERALRDLTGHAPFIEDMWKGYFCIATNYSKACEAHLRSGPLSQAIRASVAIPGALPPVLMKGELFCDGGTFNNFPVDVMRGVRGVGKVIGVDLNFRMPRRIEMEEIPGSWALLRDRFRPRKQRLYKLPSLMTYLMNVTILYSMSRQRQARNLTHLYFNPPLDRIGMLDWSRFDQIVDQGYRHACEVLDGSAPHAP